jgi:hypothetical protein
MLSFYVGDAEARISFVTYCQSFQYMEQTLFKLIFCFCTYLLTYLLTYLVHGAGYYVKSCHSACQKISCYLYETRRFIIVFTKARHRTLS